jgi:DeoR/GlpR family transcriptional regulator of sugar metabolism
MKDFLRFIKFENEYQLMKTKQKISRLKRQNQILTKINYQGKISIQEIVEEFGISEPSAWRDLINLEKMGEIRKVYGGAEKIKEYEEKNLDFERRYLSNLAEKQKLAKFAAENFIEDGDILYFDGGTTIMCMLPYIKNKNITIITNGIYTLLRASQSASYITVICPGGELFHKTCTFGGIPNEIYKKYRANKYFLSGTGISVDRGITDPSILENEVKRAMSDNSDWKIGIFDSSKINKTSMTVSTPLSALDSLIISKDCNEFFIKKVKEIPDLDLYLI